MRKDIRYTPLLWGLLLLLLSACNGEDSVTEPAGNYDRLRIPGEIAGSSATATPAADAGKAPKASPNIDELGSHKYFVAGDNIGFFSVHRNNCNEKRHDDGDDCYQQYYRNKELTYTSQKAFEDLDPTTSDDNIFLSTLGNTFAYFPYSSREVSDYRKSDGTPLLGNEHYVHIFKETEADAPVELADILTAAAQLQYGVSYTFRHRFSILLFCLGEGFPEAENTKLKVKLKEKILGAHITRNKNQFSAESDTLSFIVDRCALTEMKGRGHSEFYTSELIEDYQLQDTDKPKNVYRVILPPASQVDYVELLDATGKTQKVKLPKSILPELASACMYMLTIKMDGISPTVYPHEIKDWNEEKEITVSRLAGIYSLKELKAWSAAYQSEYETYKGDLSLAPNELKSPLSPYGIKKGNDWTFHIRNNIDCSALEDCDILIPTLGNTKASSRVILEGGKYILSNLTLKANTEGPHKGNTGIIGKITTNGHVRNLRLENVTVNGGPQGTSAGCIAAKISGGEVSESTVKMANMTGDGYVGVLAGTMTDGTSGLCKFRGLVTAPLHQEGDETLPYRGIVGRKTGGSIEDNTINQVSFAEKKTEP